MYKIIPIDALKDNYIWCISNTLTKTCIIVDPGEAEPALNCLKENNLSLEAVFITHHHWDHTNGVNGILEKHPVPVYNTGESLEMPLCKLNFKIISIPGHTLDHIAFYSPGMVFSGDTLFTAGCGRIFEGTAEQMYTSLMKLAALPDDTLVYCGHEYTESNLKFALTVEPHNNEILKRLETTISLRKRTLPTVPATLDLEKKTNPFLRVQCPSVIAAAEAHAQRHLETPIEVLQVIRTWKDHF